MPELDVTFSKLERFCKENGSFDLTVQNKTVLLSFAPTFPEAVEKGDSFPPKVMMTGSLVGDKVEFYRIEIEDESGQRIREYKTRLN